MKTTFKDGQKAYIQDLEGVVEVRKYDLVVRCINGKVFKFTFDGRLSIDTPKILSHTPYTLEGFTSEQPYEIGELYLFSDSLEKLNKNSGLLSVLTGIRDEDYKFCNEYGNHYKYAKRIKIEEV